MLSLLAGSLLLASTAVAAPCNSTSPSGKCTVSFEGRIASSAKLADFDNKATSNYDPAYVLGHNTTWSTVLDFPSGSGASLFSPASSYKAVEVKINDNSIFQPGDASSAQVGFRRSELLPTKFNGNSTAGVKTFHFSVQANAAKPLNFSHEYQLAFIESSDYSTNQFVLKAGTQIGSTPSTSPTLFFQGNQNKPTTLFSVPFDQQAWHNFAITQDFNADTVKIYYSTNNSPLVAKTEAVANDNKGNGQFHFGILKKPTGTNTDVTKTGYQPSGIDERIRFAGVFQEDSASGCVSLS